MLPLAICFLLSACGGVPQTFYYTLEESPAAVRESSDNHHDQLAVVLGVERFAAAAVYEEDRFIYRDSPFEVKYDHYRRWAARPAQLVTDEIIRQLAARRLFRNVIAYPAATPVDYILRGRILAFEEWDRGEQWFGRVAFEVQLYRAPSQQLVWNGTLSREMPAEKRRPAAVVQAISTSLQQCVDELATALSRELKR
ncbi:MAG: PqiC family protein [candidate division KSB1 bacterium]|nr:PqiC family protein [candidate division KSB1 bacterium]MDZ7273246.1 PqiC family protein [candidate division KSB1 bacterium]MDZ7285348.1 PqiC family protein [candidate division KSB1 bacterium]MDZ7298380.1 PqiC family protein [candidate division KSB1 bacterium]MDZ7306458.1 PqiC family protein [candidate division KSB1 bacterium]